MVVRGLGNLEITCVGVFQDNMSRRNDAFDDLEAWVGTYELCSNGGEQVKQPPQS